MKKTLLLCFLITSLVINSQTPCDDANAYLANAYSHVKDAYDSNNISHLKYFSNRSVESLKLSKKTLGSCDCQTALDLADKSIELLVKVEHVKTFEDGRFYVKRARDISKESVIESDKCYAGVYKNSDDNVVVDSSNTNKELTELQNEQLKIKQLQESLKLKEEQIKAKLAFQKEKELTNKKEQLIVSYTNALSSNIKTFNESLKACECNNKTIENSENLKNVSTKSIEDIRNFYMQNIKTLATEYLSKLNSCQ